MLVIDFEVFKYDWTVKFLDINKRKIGHIVNDPVAFSEFYETYKNDIWIGFNVKGYDQYVAKAILCGFNPKEVSDWIVVEEKNGWEYSNLFNRFPIRC